MPNNVDPLAKFRTPAIVETPATESGYEAFGVKDKTHRLKIRRVRGLNHAASYAFLLDVVTDGTGGNLCLLVFTFITFKIIGRDLQALYLALEADTVDYIQEYDAQRWPGLAASVQPVPLVESIEVISDRRQSDEEIAALKAGR